MIEHEFKYKNVTSILVLDALGRSLLASDLCHSHPNSHILAVTLNVT